MSATAETFDEVEFQAGGKYFRGSKCLLSSYSSYFKRKFQSGTAPYLIENVDATSMEIILEILYSGSTVKIAAHNVASLLIASEHLELQEMLKFCRKFLSKNLDQVSTCDDFLNMNYRNVNHVISKVDRAWANETKVFRAIENWTRHYRHFDPRHVKYVELFTLMKLNRLHSSYLKNVVLKSSLVNDNYACVGLIMQQLQKRSKSRRAMERHRRKARRLNK